MFAVMYEPERMNRGLVEGGVTHAVNVDRIEDIYFWGDMARVCLVSGAQFNVTRADAIAILDVLDNCRGGASKAIAETEDAGRSHESAMSDVANLKGVTRDDW
jgi:hypothetical protein